MTVRETIAKNFRQYRLACRLTQRQVADHLGLHRPAISQIESTKRGARPEELIAAAELFGVSFEDIVCGRVPTCPTCGQVIRDAEAIAEAVAREPDAWGAGDPSDLPFDEPE